MAIDRQATPIITNQDSDRLSALAESQYSKRAEISEALLQELARAQLVEPREVPPQVVTMNSRVQVREADSQTTREYSLVYPGNEDISRGNLSIMTPVGTALLGMSEGETLSWTTRSGQAKKLTVVKILYQPEAAGQYDL